MAEFINTIDALGDDVVMDSIIDRSITEFKDDRITKIGDHAFHMCNGLTTVDLPNVTGTGYYSFAGCGALVNVNLPLATVIHQYCFQACNSLRKITIVSAIDINNAAFLNSESLQSVDTSAAKNIQSVSFSNCSSLISLILRNEAAVCKMTSTNGLNNTPIESGTGYIYVPRALVDSYKTATNWSTYADQFRALEDYTVDGTTTGELDETKI